MGIHSGRFSFLPGLGIQTRLQRILETKWEGCLPVGNAAIVPTLNDWIPHMIAAPTMERPSDVSGTDNAYLATSAALRAVKTYNDWASKNDEKVIYRILIPGMATGIGCMDVDTSARQMRRAVDEALSKWDSW